MCTPECIIQNLGCIAFDAVAKAWKYVHHYRTNLENLQTEMRNLEDRAGTIQRQVGEAIGRGREVEDAVSHWQEGVTVITNHVQQLREQCAARENMHCFTRSCPNITWRYRLSKQAEQKIVDVNRLIQDGHFNEISHTRPPPPELESCFNENYVNMDSRMEIFKSIVAALKDPSFNKIGVHGLGGVGKTTIVKEVGKKMLHDRIFEQILLVAVSNDLNVKEIQSKLADCLYFEFKATGEMGRAKELWDRLNNGNKHLVILDDIWENVDLNAIGIPITNGKTGCKVLLTSRNADLLRNTMEVDRDFPIEELKYDEAWTLFKEKLGNSIEAQSELLSIAHEVCEKCKGLPVAINALGAALKSKPLHAWKTALDNLKRYMPTNIEGIKPSVWSSLMVSYEMLHSPNAQSCFLLCCLFAEDAEISIEDLTRHCVARSLLLSNPRTFDEATNAVSTSVGVLKSSSLLLNGSNENVVRIHDIIRDVGISIALKEKGFLVDHGAPRWPSNPIDKLPYSAISLRSLKIKRLPDVSKCPQLHTLILDNSELSDLEIPDKFFSGMEKLTVLVLNQMHMKRLPSSLAKLTELRMLCLNECVLEDIAILANLKTTLEVLSLRGSNITALPREIAQLTSLRVLDLQDCNYLKVIPQGVISNLTNLEELYFPETFEEWADTTNKERDTSNNNVSLEEISNLIRSMLSTTYIQLTTLHITIPDVMLLPSESLKRFKIIVGRRDGADLTHKYSRVALELHKITFKNELIPLVGKAEVLYLYKIEALQKAVPLWSFNKLIVLKIQDCKTKYLFSESTARGLVHLELLVVAGCNSMEEIVRFEGQNDEDELVKFNKLKELNLQRLPNLISFYAKKEKMEATKGSSSRAQPLFNEKVIFPALEKLFIWTMPSITKIWDKQPLAKPEKETESFCKLEFVILSDCEQLVYVCSSSMLPQLQNLQTIEITDCKELEVIVSCELKENEVANNDVIGFPQLKNVTLSGLNKLTSFCSGTQVFFSNKVNFPVLENLGISELHNIVEIWDKHSALFNENAESFSQLESLGLSSCTKLMSLGPSTMLGRLQNLQELFVCGCPNIEFIFSENGKEEEEEAADDSTMVIIPQLRTLTIEEVKNLKSFYSSSKRSNAQSLFNHQISFPVLKQLHVGWLGNIIEIWDKQSLLVRENAKSFSQLEEVMVDDCAKLMHLVPSNILPRLQNLQNLYVRNCQNMEYIIYENGKEEEKVCDDSTLLIIPQLRILTIQKLGNLKNFYSSSKRSNAQSLFNHQISFPVLKQLHVGWLGNITEIWDKQFLLVRENAKSFSQLEEVMVNYCAKLMHLVPSNIVPRLQNLRNLHVLNCQNMEYIVYENGKEEEKVCDDSTLLIIPQLRILTIKNMGNLKNFYSSSKRSNAQSFFNHQVIFPVLNNLYVSGLGNTIEIWDKQSLLVCENAKSFSQLEYVGVEDCAKLMNLVPSNILPRLHNLQVKSCPNIESIIYENGKDEEKAFDDSTLVIIPQLRFLTIENMENLKSFYSSSKRSNIAQSLFNHQIIFPALEGLSVRNMHNITEIWDKQPLSKPEKETESFCKLDYIIVDDCEQLVYVFPSYMLHQLHILRELRVRNCKQLEVIVSTELKEKEAANNDVIVFPQLLKVELEGLNKLTSFCSGTQVFFSNKDAFPILKRINLDENLKFFRNGISTEKKAIEECGTSGKENDHNGEEG